MLCVVSVIKVHSVPGGAEHSRVSKRGAKWDHLEMQRSCRAIATEILSLGSGVGCCLCGMNHCQTGAGRLAGIFLCSPASHDAKLEILMMRY